MAVAAAAFGDVTGRQLLDAVSSWVGVRLAYVSGSSRPTDGAVDTYLARQGVCRDFAHLAIALLRARNVPARLAAVEKRLRIGATRILPDSDIPSEAEVRVLRLLATSLSQREVADELYISINTVKTHTKALYQKLGTSSRQETVRRARELGLL